MTRFLSAFAAAALLGFALTPSAIAADCSVGDAAAGVKCDTIAVGNVTIHMVDDMKRVMRMCEYNHMLSSPGGVVEMPVHILGITDDRNMARCYDGRWLPASIVHLPGEPVASQ